MKQKCLEYYMDSKTYTTEQVQISIDETKKEFANKKVYSEVSLNEFGVYVITFYFESKNTIWNRIRIFFKRKDNKKLLLEKQSKIKQDKTKSRLEKYYGNSYGQYKQTQTYKPF